MKNIFQSNTNFAIHVTDLYKAEKFYSDILGFKLIEKTKNQLVFDTRKIRLFINKDVIIKPFIPAFEVEDITKAKTRLLKNNCKIINEWTKHKAFYFEDAFGICLNVIEKKN